MPFFPTLERVCPERLHAYEVQLIDGTVRAGDAEGCWPRGGSLEFMATVMTCGRPVWTCVQRVSQREAVQVGRDGQVVWSTMAMRSRLASASELRRVDPPNPL